MGSWTQLQAPVGANISALTIDGDGILYAAGTGIFASPDEGVSWRPVNRGLTNFEILGLFADGKTIFAGTKILMRSEDQGALWRATEPQSSVGHMAVIGGQGDLVVVGSTYGGDALSVSNDGGRTFQQHRFSADVTDLAVLGSVVLRAGPSGMLRSTDRGLTFEGIPGIKNGISADATLRCDRVRTCYASAHTGADFTPPVIFKSTDAGATWTNTAKVSFKVLAVSESGSVYVANPSVPAIDRSDDGGATWTTVPAAKMEQNCRSRLLARGNKLFAACSDGVYRSDDKGATWGWAGGSPATGAITGSAVVLADTGPNALGPNGDLYLLGTVRSEPLRSSDDGKTWQGLTIGFTPRQCVVTEQGVLACLSYTSSTTTVHRSEDHGATWTAIEVNPAGASLDARVTPDLLATRGSALYAAGLGLARSDDGGRTFRPIPVAFSRVNALQILKGGQLLAEVSGGVQRSTDGGITWKQVPFIGKLPLLEAPSGRLVADGGSGSSLTSTDVGDTWAPVPYSELPTTIAGSRFGPSATDGAGRMFLSHYTWMGPRVYVSNDDGVTWAALAAQPAHPNVLSFVVDKRGRLLAATSAGIYRLD